MKNVSAHTVEFWPFFLVTMQPERQGSKNPGA